MLYVQNNFSSGLDLISANTAIALDKYQWMVNARQRFGVLQANKKAIVYEDAPAGLKQGIVSVGNVIIIFVAGFAYWQHEGDTSWVPIAGFAMDTVANQYYTQTVPASVFNYVRKRGADSATSPMLITTDFNVSGNPAGVVVQDGTNQPWIIIYDPVTDVMIARVTKTYAQWSNASAIADDREYVPKGKQMMFLNQILFIQSQDGRRLYRSVTGRPLDFMVNVDVNGNKLASEQAGGAASVSFAMDSDIITCLSETNIPDSFIYATARNTRIVSLDYVNSIFDEPTFTQSALLRAGIVNQHSVVEILGDYAFIDFEGIKSFNAVLQLRNEGRNSIFSIPLSRLLRNKKQTNPVCVEFDNYAIFDLDTAWGRMFAVFDTLRNAWVAFDIIQNVGTVKQFALVETTTATKLYAVTEGDKVVQLYSSDDIEVGIFVSRAYVPEEPKAQQKGKLVSVLLENHKTEGFLQITEYIDEQISGTILQKVIDVKYAGVNYPVQAPVIPSNKKRMQNIPFVFTNGLQGRKVYYVFKWNTLAKIYEFQIETSDFNPDQTPAQANKEVSRIYGTNS